MRGSWTGSIGRWQVAIGVPNDLFVGPEAVEGISHPQSTMTCLSSGGGCRPGVDGETANTARVPGRNFLHAAPYWPEEGSRAEITRRREEKARQALEKEGA